MLTDHQRTLVRESWTQAAPHASAVSTAFYERLFARDPSSRALFARTDMASQQAKLVHMLDAAIAQLDNLDGLAPVVEALGRRHLGYGVRDAQYVAVGEALLFALEHVLGPAFTPATHDAWAVTYRLLAGIMRSASAGGPAPLGVPASRAVVAALAACVLANMARPAEAQDIDTRNATPVVAVTIPSFGQTFTAPAWATTLDDFCLSIVSQVGFSTYRA
jgi:hemoglobin-like flavoprotein